MTEGDGTVKSKEVQHAEKIYATLRECREQSGVKKNKGKRDTDWIAPVLYIYYMDLHLIYQKELHCNAVET